MYIVKNLAVISCPLAEMLRGSFFVGKSSVTMNIFNNKLHNLFIIRETREGGKRGSFYCGALKL